MIPLWAWVGICIIGAALAVVLTIVANSTKR